MDYTTALWWYASWPVLIWLSYRFVVFNLDRHARLERLEESEAENRESPRDHVA